MGSGVEHGSLMEAVLEHKLCQKSEPKTFWTLALVHERKNLRTAFSSGFVSKMIPNVLCEYVKRPSY